MRFVYLVSCVAKKGQSPAAASELYQSDWFKKAAAFVQGRLQPGNAW